jgi:peptide/nickel transport system permease protein
MKPLTMWDRLVRAVRDRSFILGSILVSVFILVAVLGPEVAPHNPFLRDRIQTIDGQMQSAPFPPSSLYPLGTDSEGRDMLSLLLHGARQTLVMAFVAMTVRLLLGLLLGTVSGWWPGSYFDRSVTAVTEFLAAIPGLILAILLVFAIGIRRGQVTFILALSLVGWGEVTQIVRGHVIVLRNRLFILASRAVGLGSVEILSRHVLPNLLAILLSIAALEMGAVLLLQGELGFLHIFIGGGGRYVSDAVGAVHYFEIPDWGAMMGTSWAYFRSLPWLPMAPALAFFVTILGFNLFGYGLQRFIEKGRFHPSGWSVVRFFAVVAVLLLGARALLAGSSLEAQLEGVASEFNVQRAWNDIAYLTHPDLEGRPPGPGGGYLAAGYIAQQFEQLDLTPLPRGGYFQTFAMNRPVVTTVPTLEIVGQEATLQFGSDFSFDPNWPFEGEFETEGELVVLANYSRGLRVDHPAESVLLLLDRTVNPPGQSYFSEVRYAGALLLASDEDIPAGHQPPPSIDLSFFSNQHDYASFLITESSARQMLAGVGLDLDELVEMQEAGEKIELYTGIQVQLEAQNMYEEVTGVNVIGYIPAADMMTAGDRIMVVAEYTGPYPQGDTYYPGADENASAVATMLEVARLWREQGFDPKRTVTFVALDASGGRNFVNNPNLPTSSGDTWTVLILDGLAAGGDRLSIQEQGFGLAHAFEDSSRRFGVRTEQVENYRFFFVSYGSTYSRQHDSYSGLAVTRVGDEFSGTAEDMLGRLDPQLLWEAGQAVSHYLMVLANR